MRARSFSHVGITVSSFNKAVQFYWDVFRCPLVGVAETPPERVRSFFHVDAAQTTCKIGWIRAPGGAVLEIFEFQPQLPPGAVPWNRVGLTHISFDVRNLQRWYDYLVSKGVECVSKPERSPRGHSFFFAKDFDGNLIELMDLGYMYHVLKWLGPIGGWIFRRGMYKQYYSDPGPLSRRVGAPPHYHEQSHGGSDDEDHHDYADQSERQHEPEAFSHERLQRISFLPGHGRGGAEGHEVEYSPRGFRLRHRGPLT